MCTSSIMTRSNGLNASILLYTDWIPATITGASVSRLSSPAEYTPTFSSGQMERSFPAFCSTSSLTWARIITRPFQSVTASFATCAMQSDFPPAVGMTTQGFVSFSRRCA